MNNVEKLRNSKDIEFFEQLLTDIREQDKEIQIPSRKKLFTEKIELKEEPEGNININGSYVHPIFARIVNMLSMGLTPIIAVVGKEGYGKSMTALYIAHTLHNELNVLRGDLNVQDQVLYSVLEYLFNERNSTRQAQIFEEANETLNSNDYHSPMNKAVAGSIRTQRKRENCKIFVCPELGELDPRIKKKADIVIEMKDKQFADITTYKVRHAKKTNRGMDFFFNNDYPYFSVPDVPKDLKNQYDNIDNSFKGSYLDDLILEVLQKKIKEIEEQTTAKI